MLRVWTFFSRQLRSPIALLEKWLFGYLHPSRATPVLAMLGDLALSRAELIAENALLRLSCQIITAASFGLSPMRNARNKG